jgi:hypothetical protein
MRCIQYEEHIREVCAGLKSVKKFTRACELSDERLSEWTTSRWFMERVFDHFMLNAVTPQSQTET